MKKIICALLSSALVSSVYADPETVRVYNQNPEYSVFVNYQACFRDFKKSNQPAMGSCYLPVFNATIPAGQPYLDITLPDYADYGRVISAYDINEDSIVAEGYFPGEEGCRSWPNDPANLDNRKSIKIYCSKR